MGNIQIRIDTVADASAFDVRGEATADDIIAAMTRQYVAGSPRHAIWDYTRAAFHRLETADYIRIATAAKDRAAFRVGGKTAFIAPGKQGAVAIKLLEAMSRVIDLPIPLRICQTEGEAIDWLAADDGANEEVPVTANTAGQGG